MIIRSPRPETNWTVIQNTVLRHPQLTFKARGLLAYLLSLPDNWSISAERLAQGGPDGRDAIRSALSELEKAGYLRRERRQNNRGQWCTQSIIYDTPCGQLVKKDVNSHVDK